MLPVIFLSVISNLAVISARTQRHFIYKGTCFPIYLYKRLPSRSRIGKSRLSSIELIIYTQPRILQASATRAMEII